MIIYHSIRWLLWRLLRRLLLDVSHSPFNGLNYTSWKHRPSIRHSILPSLQQAFKAPSCGKLGERISVKENRDDITRKQLDIWLPNILTYRIYQVDHRKLLTWHILQQKRLIHEMTCWNTDNDCTKVGRERLKIIWENGIGSGREGICIMVMKVRSWYVKQNDINYFDRSTICL